MKIALFGYGKMGKVIEKIAIERGHEIVLKIEQGDASYNLKIADVAIDFSTPTAAVSNITKAINCQIPVVCGTTGWLEAFESIKSLCHTKNGAFLYASNFSLGMNLFFELNRKLAQVMKPYGEYSMGIEEIHHTQKQDAPSGTSITLAEDAIKENEYTGWSLGQSLDPKQICIEAKRIENIPGTHSVSYDSKIDSIEIKHIAKNREGFGLGAVIAAEWLLGKTGVFSMKDVLNIK
ncbi:MAG: 4-hydroxy-tetrahydrodipicolinate reductase [Flavobacteriaceae bacterium]|nr:4-hydroxy-tetrahydrodipicolinate reductase [Flavobacteriaceae bacterium]